MLVYGTHHKYTRTQAPGPRSRGPPTKHAAAKLQQQVAVAAGGSMVGPRVQQERQLWMQLIEQLRKRCARKMHHC